MCQQLWVRDTPNGKQHEILTGQALADLIGMDRLLQYNGDETGVEPFAHDGGSMNYCLCPFALRETMESAGYDVEDDHCGYIATRRNSPPAEGGV